MDKRFVKFAALSALLISVFLMIFCFIKSVPSTTFFPAISYQECIIVVSTHGLCRLSERILGTLELTLYYLPTFYPF